MTEKDASVLEQKTTTLRLNRAPLGLKVEHIIGRRFGRLLVISIESRGERSGPTVKSKCDCGFDYVCRWTLIAKGQSVSCGCWKRDRTTTHGLSRTPTYYSWREMLRRCLDHNSPWFPRYGARGITICQRWQDSLEHFVSDMGIRPPGLTLDRFPDNNGNYEPGNCRWATVTEQNRNRRSNRVIEFRGEKRLTCEWAEITGIRGSIISQRIDRDRWSIDEALTVPCSRAQYRLHGRGHRAS